MKDPDAMLRRIRSCVVALARDGPGATPREVHDLIQAVTNLDNHLSWGGTAPDNWNGGLLRAPTTHHASTTSPPSSSMFRPVTTFPATATEAHERHPVEDIMRRM